MTSSSKASFALTFLTAMLIFSHIARGAGGGDAAIHFVVIREQVNIRQDPSTSSPVLKAVRAGEKLRHLGQKGNWHQVELTDGRKGWVYHTLVTKTDEAISPFVEAPVLRPADKAPIASVAPGEESSLPPLASINVQKDTHSEVVQITGDLRPAVGMLMSMTILLGLLWFLLWRYRARRRLRLFLFRALPCSLDRSRFFRSKSLFDILIDFGVSLESLTLLSMDSGPLLCEPLCWIPVKRRLNYWQLNEAVKESVEFYGTYEAFVTAMKARLQGTPTSVEPSNIEQDLMHTGDQSITKIRLPSYERLVEERRAFDIMIRALQNETKTELARRLGITHRFDYMTSELFRSIAESEERRIAVSLTYKPTSKADNADLFLVLGQLSAMAAASLWAMDAASTAVAWGAGASDWDFSLGTEGADGGFEGIEGLGELALIAGAIFLTAGVFKTIGKFWRERHLRRYQTDFKRHMEALAALFFKQGEEAALRVPKLVIEALALEQARIEQLLGLLQHKPLGGDPKSNISRLARVATREAYILCRKMLGKLMREVEGLLQNVSRYAKDGRHDLAGVHLYMNRDLVFLPSQLPEKQLEEIHATLKQLFQEVDRLRKTESSGH